jgi:hypothetical protein
VGFRGARIMTPRQFLNAQTKAIVTGGWNARPVTAVKRRIQ